jgi:hypothetical protein
VNRGQFARFPIADIASGDVLSSSSRPTIVVAGDDGSDDVYFANTNGTYSVPSGSRLRVGHSYRPVSQGQLTGTLERPRTFL